MHLVLSEGAMKSLITVQQVACQSQQAAAQQSHAAGAFAQAGKQAVAAVLASLQIAALAYTTGLALPAPAQAVLNSPNARIARR